MSNTGSTIIVKIEKWVQNGLTIAYIDERPIFVHGALPGETVEIEIRKELSNYSFGQTIRVIESSENRIESDCVIFPECGGCSFRHISYDQELNLKTLLLAEHQYLSPHINQLKIFSNEPNGYRHHSRLHQQNHKVGFFSSWTKTVVNLPYLGCRQLAPALNNALKTISKKDGDFQLYLNSNNQVEVTTLTGAMPKQSKQKSQPKNTTELNFKFNNFNWKYRPGQFFQANRFLIGDWLNYIQSLISENRPNTVELFCGTGLIGGYVRSKLGNYVGVESVGSSLNQARENFANHKLTGKFHLVDLYQLKDIDNLRQTKADLWIVNPPRAGLKSTLCQMAIESSLQEIIYSSCNAATLSRDIGELKAAGFTVTDIAAFDFFPRTPHLEVVLKLKRTQISKL